MVLIFAAGCGSTGRESNEIVQTLSTRAEALNTRDADRYLSVISRNYNDKGTDFGQLSEKQRNNFKKFERIRYEADKPSITVTGTSAASVGRYRMKVVVQGKEVVFNGTEQLKLVKEPEGWKIIAGI